MEYNLKYCERRAAQELAAARTALTKEGRERRLALAASFQARAAQFAS